MQPFEQFAWGILPYLVLSFSITAMIWRYRSHPFGWTSKSSEMLEKRLLKWGSPLFHYGIIIVFFGHVSGLLIPPKLFHSIGISDTVYHVAAIAIGLPAGIAALSGISILLYRRLKISRIRKTSDAGDFVSLFILLLVIVTGLLATSGNASGLTDFDYRTTINPWVRSVLTLQADPTWMVSVPMSFKVHIMMTFILYTVFPFTRLVHVFSLPLSYLKRSYVLYRKRRI